MHISIMQSMLSQASVESSAQTFYHHFFVSGGPIVWFILLPMSIAMVYMAIDLAIRTRRNRLMPAMVSSEIVTQAARFGAGSLAAKFGGQSDLISQALLKSLEQARRQQATVQTVRQCAAESLQETGMRLSRRAQWCQLIGTVAPMVGLFGTVYGMICAFNLLGQGSEGPRYELLADSISVALVTTFWGLLIAIPAQFFYSLFQSKIETFVSEAAIELDALISRLFEAPASVQNAPASSQPEVKSEGVENQPAQAEAKLVRQGTFLRRKQRRLGIIVQRPMMKRRADEE